MSKEDAIKLLDSEAIFYDGFDSAIIGIAERFGMESVVCYDKQKVLEKLSKDMNITEEDISDNYLGMTIEEAKFEMALEYFEFNVIGGWNGPYTPVFVEI